MPWLVRLQQFPQPIRRREVRLPTQCGQRRPHDDRGRVRQHSRDLPDRAAQSAHGTYRLGAYPRPGMPEIAADRLRVIDRAALTEPRDDPAQS